MTNYQFEVWAECRLHLEDEIERDTAMLTWEDGYELVHSTECNCPACVGLCQDDYEYASGTGIYAPRKSTIVHPDEAGALLKFMSRGRVLAEKLAYDEEYASVTASLCMRQWQQFDGVLITPFPCTSATIGKEARREMKRAYKESAG